MSYLDSITETGRTRPAFQPPADTPENSNGSTRLTSGDVLRTFVSIGNLLQQAHQTYNSLADAPKPKYAESLNDLADKAKLIQAAVEKLAAANK